MVMQSAFFKLAKVIPIDDAVRYLKDSIEKTYGRKGEKIVEMNRQAVDKGIELVKKVDIPDSWKNAEQKSQKYNDNIEEPDFVKNYSETNGEKRGG